MRFLTALLAAFVIASTGLAADPPAASESKDKPITVSFSAKEEKLSTLLEKIVKDAGVRITMELTADMKITASVTDIPLEDALSTICKGNNLAWRKIYIRADSPLLKKPDTLASTVRLMAGMKFPDLLIDRSSASDNLVHVANKPAVDAIPTKLRKDLGMVMVYLVTNEKAAEAAEAKANTKLAKYFELQKEAMKLFMEMTPEEREQAMASGVQMMQQYDPKYMAEAAKAVIRMGPEALQPLMQQQTQMLFSMPAEDRRALIRMQMQSMQYITPEQQKMLQEDAMAVMKEMGIGPGRPQPPQQ